LILQEGSHVAFPVGNGMPQVLSMQMEESQIPEHPSASQVTFVSTPEKKKRKEKRNLKNNLHEHNKKELAPSVSVTTTLREPT